MGKAGNLQQVGKGFRLCLQKHLANKRSTHFGDRQRACFPGNVFFRYAERFGTCAKANDLRVANIHLHHGNPRQILQMAVQRRHIVAENIQFQNRIVQRMEVEVRGFHIARGIVGGELHRRKVADLIRIRHNDHAAGVLPCGALDARAPFG